MIRVLSCFFALVGMCCCASENSLRAETTSTIIELNQENSKKTFDSSHFLVIDVYAEWCTPCKRLKPIFNELNAENGTQYQFAQVNAENDAAFVERFQITGFPTILFIKDGKEVGRQVGFMNKEQLLDVIKKQLKD